MGRELIRRLGAALALAGLAGLLAWVLAHAVPLPERLAAPASPVVAWSDHTPAHVFLAADDRWRIPVSLDEVDPALVEALVALEDRRFWWHPGVDPLAVCRAAVSNLRRGRRVSGASTLSMQLARLLEPRPRTVRSKAVEVLRAMQLEIRLGKRGVLEAWLTLAPYGRNLEGVEAASLAAFGRPASHLSPAEIATLLAIPQDPNRRHPSPANAQRLQASRDLIAARLLAQGALAPGEDPAEVLATLRDTPVPDRLRPQPRSAPHAARWFLARTGPVPRVPSTLDRDVQGHAERLLLAARPDLARRGVDHAAVVVIEHATGEIRGLVGGFGFFDDTPGAQIPAFAVPRSPGSTLKPFVYAEAIDRGLMLPETLLLDVPVRYGGYAPVNYDGGFDGVVRAEDALSRSLNIPFVDLLRQLGTERFLATLRDLGVRSLDPEPGSYGLSLVIGGIELSPLETAVAYAALARGGEHLPPRWHAEASEPRPRRVFSEGASHLTRRALALRDRPDFPTRRDWTSLPRRIHWKTGTSYGHRDAWSVGSGRRYTVAVWLGNLDQRPSVHLVGAEAAAPLLFDLLEALHDGAEGPEPPPPPELTRVTVCALSGRVPGEACPETTEAWARRDRVPPDRCALHVRIEVDEDSGLAVGPLCREGRNTRTDTWVVWPGAARRYLAGALASPPPPDPTCGALGAHPPRILSPAAGEVVLLVPGLAPERQQVPLEAEATSPDAPLDWFVNGEHLGRFRADDLAWWVPRPGRHQVVVVDGQGEVARRTVEVRGMGMEVGRPGQHRP